MSFMRPEALRTVSRLVEPAIAGLVAFWLLWNGVAGLAAGGIRVFLPLIGGALAALWFLVAAKRSLIALRHGEAVATTPGAVIIEEGRVGYFGPFGGSYVRFQDLVAIDLISADAPADGNKRHWRFASGDGAELWIPADAPGSEKLPDALSALPGMSSTRMLSALMSGKGGAAGIWRREALSSRQLP